MFGFRSHAKCIAYETKYLMRPRFWPPTTFPVPILWERAKAMFAVMLGKVGSAMQLAHRQTYAREQRRNLLLFLEPVEKLVRTLLCIEAITLLLMTPQGTKIRHTTPQRVPDPPPQVGKSKPRPEASRIHAAMMTIAAHHPRIDPRVTERELRERLAALEARRTHDLFDPPPLNGHLNVIRWVHDPQTRIAPPVLPKGLVLDDHTLDAMRVSVDPPGAAPDDADGTFYGPMLAIARRIDALERVLANPLPAIRRLARRIASIPRAHLEAPWPQRWRATRWLQGCPEFYNACILAKPAFAALDRAYAMPPHDPG
jgi:hypothetical protein